MATVQLATRINGKIKKMVDMVCKKEGYKIANFVEAALLDRLEEMEDIAEISMIKIS